MSSNNLEGYLAVPVWPNFGGERRLFRVFRGEEMVFEFLVPFSGDKAEEPAWYAYLPLQRFYEVRREEIAKAGFGKMQTEESSKAAPDADWSRFRIETEDARVREKCFFTVEKSEDAPVGGERPGVHFSPQYGWMNDPNGLIYDGKVWHLYCQHNPMDAAWCNMTWGHAVSEDLVHFTWKGDVLFPDSRGVMYSGSAILNGQAVGGGVWKIFPELPEAALLFFYTSAGHIAQGTSSENGEFTQRVAFSVDGGETLVKLADWELPNVACENRDPKLIVHQESRGLILVLYLDADRFGIFRAEMEGQDGPQFRLLHELRIPEKIECPDFFPLTNPANGRTLWAFVSASGCYYLGEFDGYVFNPLTNVKNLYANQMPFAAQSWSNADGRVFSIAWLRSFWDWKTPWTGTMSLVREFTLGEKEDGPYIRQRFVLQDGSEQIVDAFGEGRIVEWLSEDGELLNVESTLPAFPYPVYREGETH